jgi:hypothetical protein
VFFIRSHGDEPTKLREVIAADLTIWAFCVYCSHASLIDPAHLRVKIKGGDDTLPVVAERENSPNRQPYTLLLSVHMLLATRGALPRCHSTRWG